MATPISYGIGISDQNLQAMLNSDTPEIRQQAENYLAAAQNQQQEKTGILQRIGDFFFPPAASAEPEFNVITGEPIKNNVQYYPGTTVPIPMPFSSGMQSNFPFKSVEELPTKINYGSADDVYPEAIKGGITESTVGQTFEAPFVMAGGQKFALGDPRIDEQRNYFTRPTGIMTQAKDFFTKTVPNIASSAIDFIPGMRFIKSLDRFDTLPYEDRKFIKSAMDLKNVPGSGIYVDPNTGLLKDVRGKNVRSLMGNYAESIENDYAKKAESIDKSKDRWTEKYGDLNNTNEYGKTWNEMNKKNVSDFAFLTSMKAKFDKQKAELKEKIKKTKSINIHGGDKPTSPSGGGDGKYGVGADGQKSYDFGQGFGVSATTGGPVSNRTGRGRQDY